MSSSIGRIFTLTTFGESHGEAIGGIIDGFPAGIAIDREAIRAEMARRRPGSVERYAAPVRGLPAGMDRRLDSLRSSAL